MATSSETTCTFRVLISCRCAVCRQTQDILCSIQRQEVSGNSDTSKRTMPLVRGFVTEWAASLNHNQLRDEGNAPKCADYELNAVECMEAYGYYRGERYCRDFLEDWDECIYSRKQTHRYVMMMQERVRQVAAGQRRPVFDEFWGTKPNPQGVYEGSFRP